MEAFRKRVHACIHPETFKYFLDPQHVGEVWARLQDWFGEPTCVDGFGVLEMSDGCFFLRSTKRRNPITVIRKPTCQTADVSHLHQLLGFTKTCEKQ